MGVILLVEDDPAAAAAMLRHLKLCAPDHEACRAETAGEGLELARAREVSLFLLDIQLPDYRGTLLAKQLRALPQYRFTPILFTTEVAEAELSSWREVKCYDFLVKPFPAERFRTAVREALELGGRLAAPPAVLRLEQKRFRIEYELRNLLYIESFGKKAVIHSLAGGRRLEDPVTGYSLAKLLELAGPGRLAQCHKSFLINPSRVERVDWGQRQLWLRDCPDAIPIGEKYRKNLRMEGAACPE